MKFKLFLIFALSFNCKTIKSQKLEQLIFYRIEYIFNLKPIISEKYWKDFNNKKYDVPLMYFTDTSTYVVNPAEDFIGFYKPKFVFQPKSKNVKIYKTLKRFDDIPFHMETITDINDSTKIGVKPNPIMNCSSLEVTYLKYPEASSTEYWATMILHEYFHGFQFKHQSFTDAILEITSRISEDSLAKVYNNNIWFQEKIKIENGFLLKAIESTNQLETNSQIDNFLNSRKERRILTIAKLNFDIEEVERIYETMEGTARYIEYSLQVEFANKKPSANLLKSDKMYNSYIYFKNYRMEKDPWLFTPGRRYFYATGFNLARLLNKLKIDYKSRLFNEGNLSLEQVLIER